MPPTAHRLSGQNPQFASAAAAVSGAAGAAAAAANADAQRAATKKLAEEKKAEWLRKRAAAASAKASAAAATSAGGTVGAVESQPSQTQGLALSQDGPSQQSQPLPSQSPVLSATRLAPQSPLASAPVQAAACNFGEAASSQTTASRGGLAMFYLLFSFFIFLHNFTNLPASLTCVLKTFVFRFCLLFLPPATLSYRSSYQAKPSAGPVSAMLPIS